MINWDPSYNDINTGQVIVLDNLCIIIKAIDCGEYLCTNSLRIRIAACMVDAYIKEVRWCSIEQVRQKVKCRTLCNLEDCILLYVRTYLTVTIINLHDWIQLNTCIYLLHRSTIPFTYTWGCLQQHNTQINGFILSICCISKIDIFLIVN